MSVIFFQKIKAELLQLKTQLVVSICKVLPFPLTLLHATTERRPMMPLDSLVSYLFFVLQDVMNKKRADTILDLSIEKSRVKEMVG